LIVEDEATIRENLKTMLELAGYDSVFTANDGQEGLEILKTLPHPCLVLLDLLMPVMNGMEFLEAKRHEDAIAAIPVCIVSGVATQPTQSPLYSHFLKKPIDLHTLLSFVRVHCGAPRPKEASS
jgi:two-component system response regulator CpxR